MDAYVSWAVIFFLAAAAVSGAVLFFFVRDSHNMIPYATHASLLLSIFLCVLPFPLLALDVDAALESVDAGRTESYVDSWISVWWMLIFFATQVMAWVVLPILQEYDGAGQFTPGARFKHAIKENVRMYIVLGIVAGVLMGYIIFLAGVRSIGGMVALCLAAANAFGLTLLVVFLSIGLVGVPKLLWHLSSAETILKEEYRRGRQIHEDLDIAKTDMTLLRAEVVRRDPLVEEDERVNLATMLDEIAMLEKFVPLSHTNVGERRGADGPLQEKNLVELNAEVKRTIKICRRLQYQWKQVVKECCQLERVTTGVERSPYWVVVRAPLLKILAVLAGIVTLLILWSELVVPFQEVTATKLSVVEIFVMNPTTRFVACVLFLYYMAGCCYWAVFRLRVFDIYVVVPRVSDGASLCFVSTFLTRVLLPLCYNFLFISDLTKTHTLVTYSRLFGNMDVVVFLGEWFNRFMPVFIPILAVLIELKVIHRLMQAIGIEGFETGEESAIQRQREQEEGRQLVARAMNSELRDVAAGAAPAAAAVAISPAAAAGGEMQEKPKPAVSKRYEEWKAKRAAREAGTTDV